MPYKLLRHTTQPLVAPDHDRQSAPRRRQPGAQLDQRALLQRPGHRMALQAGKTRAGHGHALDGFGAVELKLHVQAAQVAEQLSAASRVPEPVSRRIQGACSSWRSVTERPAGN